MASARAHARVLCFWASVWQNLLHCNPFCFCSCSTFPWSLSNFAIQFLGSVSLFLTLKFGVECSPPLDSIFLCGFELSLLVFSPLPSNSKFGVACFPPLIQFFCALNSVLVFLSPFPPPSNSKFWCHVPSRIQFFVFGTLSLGVLPHPQIQKFWCYVFSTLEFNFFVLWIYVHLSPPSNSNFGVTVSSPLEFNFLCFELSRLVFLPLPSNSKFFWCYVCFALNSIFCCFETLCVVFLSRPSLHPKIQKFGVTVMFQLSVPS